MPGPLLVWWTDENRGRVGAVVSQVVARVLVHHLQGQGARLGQAYGQSGRWWVRGLVHRRTWAAVTSEVLEKSSFMDRGGGTSGRALSFYFQGHGFAHNRYFSSFLSRINSKLSSAQ